jgi:hypothetical protein
VILLTPLSPEQAEADALEQLRAFVRVPGALRVITATVRERWRSDPRDRRSLPDLGAVFRYRDLMRRPTTFELQDVVRLEPVEEKPGTWRATTAEGSTCEGRPVALLRRLREWRR